MITRKEVKLLLKKIQYKPGWTFHLDDSGDITITARVRDTYSRRYSKVRTRSYVVDAHRSNPAGLLNAIYDAVERLEIHEAREWFKYENRRVFDPHE